MVVGEAAGLAAVMVGEDGVLEQAAPLVDMVAAVELAAAAETYGALMVTPLDGVLNGHQVIASYGWSQARETFAFVCTTGFEEMTGSCIGPVIALPEWMTLYPVCR